MTLGRSRLWSSALISILVIVGTVIPATGAIKAGSPCKKAEQVRAVKGVSLKCVKAGKKLVWRKVASAPVVIPAVEASPTQSPIPTVTPTVTPSASPKPTPSPTPLAKKPDFNRILWARDGNLSTFPIELEVFAIPTVRPSNWNDLYEKRDGIAYRAWEQTSSTIAKSISKAGELVIHQGPNTIPNYSEIKQVIDSVSRAFPNAKEVKKTNAFIYNFRDRFWADETYQRIYRDESERFKEFYGRSALNNCQVQREVCWAMAFTDSNTDGVMLLGVIDNGSREQLNQTYSEYARSSRGLVIAHEYFHTIQRRILGDNWFQMQYTPPIWFNEGSAVFIENAVMNHQSFDSYMRFRAVDSKLAYPGCSEIGGGCFNVDLETLNRFFSLTNYESNWSNFPYGMKYEVSSRIIEILVSLKGPESLTDLYSEMAQRRTFEVAFERVYGIPYREATAIISRILVDQYNSRT